MLSRIVTIFCHRNRKILIKEFHNSMHSRSSILGVQINNLNGVALVTMQRSPANALNIDLMQNLSNTIDDLVSNKTRGMILTSDLPTIFSAGLDFTEFIGQTDKNRRHEFWKTFQNLWLKLYGASFPTAAAINGHSPAGGCVLALCCEYRVMVDGKSKIGLNENAFGFPPPAFVQNTLKNVIANREAELAILFGKLYNVEEALKIGMIDEIANDKLDAIEKCQRFLQKFSKISPMARTISKLSYREKTLKELEDGREKDLQKTMDLFDNQEFQHNVKTYIQSIKKK